ncbi:MAG: heavy metal translocating P-type ATPase [Bacillota bacterium]|nr:heavy metal translocating P-type ATPase [Bacillota bacterium]
MAKKEKYNVTGMTCAACSAAVEKNVKKLKGVKNISVNLLQNNMSVEFEEGELTQEDIIKAVEDAGYGAYSADESKTNTKSKSSTIDDEYRTLKIRLIVSIIFTVPLFYLAMGHMAGWPLPGFFLGTENAINFAFTQFLLTLPVMIVNRKFYTIGFKTLWKRSPNMDSLIAVGTSAAALYGIFAIYKIGAGLGTGDMSIVMQYSHDLYFESAGVILTLITFGKFLEGRAKGKTSEAIEKLINLAPKMALMEKDGEIIEVPVEDVNVGDIIIVKPGQSVPVDGEIVEGKTSIDESMLTGESIPVEKNIGDKVIGASINKTGYIKFKATKVGEDTTLSQIITLVEEAQASKAPIAKMADKISSIFVPVVLSIALVATVVWLLLGYSFEFALSIGIAVLVISCPCALGLATPTAIMVGTGKGAEKGILIKSGEALEIAHSIDTIVLDKTGTITEGKPVVTDIVTYGDAKEEDILIDAASAEKSSEHPLAESIINKAEEMNLSLKEQKDFEAVPGQGLKAVVDGKNISIGNLKLMNSLNIRLENSESDVDRLSKEGKTPLIIADNERVLGIIAVADTIKATSKQAVEAMKAMGINVVMLTGDNKQTAEAIRKQVGIDLAISDVMPEDKEKEVRRLQGENSRVAMVGDGINDAPALARADVGIAIGAGTDVAIESADIVLMKSDLLDAVGAVQLSKSVIRNIKQNLFWAFFYNTLGIPLAAGLLYTSMGLKLNPMFAAAAMSFSSVSVVTNALRLKSFKPVYEINKIKGKYKKSSKEIIKKEVVEMKKELIIEGMTCNHCKMRVEKELNALDQVESVEVILEEKKAVVEFKEEVSKEVLEKVIDEAGYKLVEIK